MLLYNLQIYATKRLLTTPDKQHYLHAMLGFWSFSCQMACVRNCYPMRPAYHRVLRIFANMTTGGRRLGRISDEPVLNLYLGKKQTLNTAISSYFIYFVLDLRH